MTDSAKTRALNDAFRTTFQGGRVVMTRSIADLDPDSHARIIARVRSFDAFDASNDPHQEHDFGSFEEGGDTIFWKIDYYSDDSLSFGSEDPSDPAKCLRVLTIMLAEDY